MFVIGGMEVDPVMAGTIGSIIVFILQFLMCSKVKNRHAKRVPMYTLLCGIMFGLLLFMGVAGEGSMELGNQSMGFSLVIMFVIMYVSDLLAWIVYGSYSRMKQHREDMNL